jgi:large subunit ribosomal protein L29
MLTMEELRKQNPAELKALYQDLSKEIYQMKSEFSIQRKLEKPHLLRAKKKDRARVMTLLNQTSQEKA